MATPFDQFGFMDAQQTVGAAVTRCTVVGALSGAVVGTGSVDSSPRPTPLGTSATALRQMIDGDHWLGGIGWIGPRPGINEDGATETMALLQQGFISENALADVIDRHVAGVLGREPHFSFTVRRPLANDAEPTATEAALIDEAEALITEWWDARKVHALMQSYARTLLYAQRAPARLYVPQGKLAARNDPTTRRTVREVPHAADVGAGLAFVWPDEPLPERAAVAVDPDTKESVAVVLYTAGQTVTGTVTGQQRAEISYLSGTGKTVIRQVDDQRGASDGTGTPAGFGFEFGNRLPMYEMDRPRFITAQMIQIQRAMNLVLTAMGRNTVTAGWLERIIANAQMPTRKIVDKDGVERTVAGQFKTGGGVTTLLRGLEIVDEATGKKDFATPSVTFREAGTATPLIETFEALYRAMLREAKQEHVLMGQDIKASGKAREQARADFESTLRKSAAELNACGRWLIETALAMAEAFAGTPGKFTGQLRATFDVQIDTGPVTSDERVANDASVAAGTLSRESGMAANGVPDVDAEIARANADPINQLNVLAKRATVLQALVAGGAGLEGAARVAGFTPEEARALVPTFADPANPANPANGAGGGGSGDAGTTGAAGDVSPVDGTSSADGSTQPPPTA